MACSITLKGIAMDCDANVGGVKKVLIAPYYKKADIAPVADKDAGTVKIANAKAEEFKVFEFRRGAASVTSTLTSDATTGVNYVTNELSIQFAKQDVKKRIEMSALSTGQMLVIYKDANDKYWMIGADDYATATAGTAETGAARSDANQYTLTISAEESSYPYAITDADNISALDALTAPVSE